MKYDNIVISNRGVFEIQRGKQVAGVLHPNIQAILLQYTTPANRPILEAIVGSILLLLGIKGLMLFFGSPKALRYDLAFLVLGVLGASMLFDVLKKRYVLCVSATDRVHKLSFSGSAKPDGIEAFRKDARERLGIEIESDIHLRG